jgi:DinB family protein
MRTADLLLDAFDRIAELGRSVVDGLTTDQLGTRLEGRANPIGWLVWHVARVQDDHISDVAGTEQVWTANGWFERFALPLDRDDIGYGHSPEQVAAVRVADPSLLSGYLDDVVAATGAFVEGLRDDDLDRVVDKRWDPPVTLGVRLVSVVSDDLQHLGQAAFVRGIVAG